MYKNNEYIVNSQNKQMDIVQFMNYYYYIKKYLIKDENNDYYIKLEKNTINMILKNNV